MTRIAVWTVALLAALVLPTGAAAAHAELLSMTPKDGATLATPPAEVVLKYSEAVQLTGTEVVVTAPSGTTVSTGEPDILDGVVTQKLGSLTEAGVYKIAARVVSADGHPVTATGSFTVTAGSGVAAAPAPASDSKGSRSNAAAAVSAVVLLVVAGLGIAIASRRRTEPPAEP
jgi:copper resistance protein C